MSSLMLFAAINDGQTRLIIILVYLALLIGLGFFCESSIFGNP